MNPAASATVAAAPLRHRMAGFVYEGVLLFGVVMMAGLLFSTLTGQRHALQGRHALQAFLFAVLAAYFVWFWSHGGQTLAMKTWHLRLLGPDGQPLSPRHAAARFLASWVWFLPPLALSRLMEWESSGMLSAVLVGWVLGYAALSRLHPQGQFWHDALCGTRIVSCRPEPGPAAKAQAGSDPGIPVRSATSTARLLPPQDRVGSAKEAASAQGAPARSGPSSPAGG